MSSGSSQPGIDNFNEIVRRCSIVPQPLQDFKATLNKIKFGEALDRLAAAVGLGDHSFEAGFTPAHDKEPFRYVAAVQCKTSPKEPLPTLPDGWAQTQEEGSQYARWTYRDPGSDTLIDVTIRAEDKSTPQSIVGNCLHLRDPNDLNPLEAWGTQGLLVRKQPQWDPTSPIYWTMTVAHLFTRPQVGVPYPPENGVWFCHFYNFLNQAPDSGSCAFCEQDACNASCNRNTAQVQLQHLQNVLPPGFAPASLISQASGPTDIEIHANQNLDFAAYAINQSVINPDNKILPLNVRGVQNSNAVVHLNGLPAVDFGPMQVAFHGLNQAGTVIAFDELFAAAEAGQQIFAFTKGYRGGWTIGSIFMASLGHTRIAVSFVPNGTITLNGDSGAVWFALLPTANGYVARPFGSHSGINVIIGLGVVAEVVPFRTTFPLFTQFTFGHAGTPAFQPGDSYHYI